MMRAGKSGLCQTQRCNGNDRLPPIIHREFRRSTGGPVNPLPSMEKHFLLHAELLLLEGGEHRIIRMRSMPLFFDQSVKLGMARFKCVET
jgi:hypothetical protein